MPGFNNLIPEGRAPIKSHAFFDLGGAGSTVSIEAQDQNCSTLSFVDSAGNVYPCVTISIPTGKAVGLNYAVINTQPDSSHNLSGFPTKMQRLVCRVLTGSITSNTNGTLDGSAGLDTGNSNNGIVAANVAPTANSPISHVSGETFILGRFID